VSSPSAGFGRLVALTVVAAAFGSAAFAQPGSAAAAEAGLPPLACVETLRAARIAGLSGRSADAAQRLEAALEQPGCELSGLFELFRLMRTPGGVPADREPVLRQRLVTRLEDPSATLPEGMLGFLVAFPGAPADDELLLTVLERRLAALLPPGDAAAGTSTAELLHAVADLQERLGRREAARDTLGRLLALAPTEPLRWRAVLLDLSLLRWDSAAPLLEALLAGEMAADHLRTLYTITLANLGRYDEMLAQIARLPLATPPPGSDLPGDGFVDLLLEAAWGLRQAGRASEAEALFRQAVARDPSRQEATLALLHLYSSDVERAAHAATLGAQRLAQADPQALYDEGSALLAAGDAATARELLARAAPQLADGPLAESFWYNLGLAAYKLERWEEAATAFGEAAAINPERPETHLQRGLALHRLSRCAEAGTAAGARASSGSSRGALLPRRVPRCDR
jgi:tetratricopeptide (TPR) repeat protein